MKSIEQRAPDALRELVAHVHAQQAMRLSPMTYQDLGGRIGWINKNGDPHPRVGQVLGVMGRLLDGLAGDWGEPIPHIQSLVVNKTGPDKGLPDTGIKAFWPGYEAMSRDEKQNRMMAEHVRVAAFGSRWDDVLAQLGIQAVAIPKVRRVVPRGESFAHKDLKEFVRSHPETVGVLPTALCFLEYALPSGDVVDLLFKTPTEWIAVEVKSHVSDMLQDKDYERGVYQTVKYRAVLEAMIRDGRYAVPPAIRSVLVLESKLPAACHNLANRLGVQFVPEIRVREAVA